LAYSTTNQPDALFHTRQGYLVSTPDNSGTSVTDVGHLFGRLGEGNKGMPGVSNPFYWGTTTTGDKSSIMISLFPDTDTEPGLDGTAKEIVIEGKSYTWESLDNFLVPTQPAAAINPDANSMALMASTLVATLSVASQLI